MFINIVLLRADQSVSVRVALAENVGDDLLVEGVVAGLPALLVLQLQVFFHLKNTQTAPSQRPGVKSVITSRQRQQSGSGADMIGSG